MSDPLVVCSAIACDKRHELSRPHQYHAPHLFFVRPPHKLGIEKKEARDLIKNVKNLA